MLCNVRAQNSAKTTQKLIVQPRWPWCKNFVVQMPTVTSKSKSQKEKSGRYKWGSVCTHVRVLTGPVLLRSQLLLISFQILMPDSVKSFKKVIIVYLYVIRIRLYNVIDTCPYYLSRLALLFCRYSVFVIYLLWM